MPGRYTSPRFVGREDAFARLASVLDDAASGHARTMLLRGPAGIGISRFLDEATGRIGTLSEPMTVLRAAATPVGTDEPYGPIVRALGPTLDALPPDELRRILGPAAGDVVRLLPSVGVALERSGDPVTARGAGEPERRAERIMEGVLGILGRLGVRRPVVLVLEDLHRADAATRELVTFVARVAARQRLAVIASDQPDIVPRDDPWLRAVSAIVAAPRPLESLTLPVLDRGELAALIEAVEGERASASLLLLVAERSGGSPLVAEELLAARRELPTASLTGSLDEIVVGRLSVRSVECRRVLRLIAPAGIGLTRAELAQVAARFEAETSRPAPRSVSGPRRGSGDLDADLTAGLLEGLEHGFLVERDGLIACRHELIARAIERDLLPMARTRFHAAIAAGIDGHPSAAARHWLEAHDVHAARDAAIAAADMAASRAAAADELAWLELALSLTDPDRPDGRARRRTDRRALALPGDRADLQERAAEAAMATGRTSRAIAYIESAIGLLDARRDRVRAGLLHERMAHMLHASGDPAGARAAAIRAVELVPREPSVARATVVARLAQLCMLDGIFSDATRWAKDAIKVARACDPVAKAQEIHATTTLAVALAWGRDPNAAIALLLEADAAAREIDDSDALFRISANLTTVLDLVGRRAEAVDVAYRGIEDARRAGLEAVYGNFLVGNVAESLILLGRWDEARTLTERALTWLPAGLIFQTTVPRDRGHRDRKRCRSRRHHPARSARARARRDARAAARGPVQPGGGVLRAVAGRRRRCRALGRSGVADRPLDRGMGPRRTRRRRGGPGGRRDRRRRPRASTAGARWRPPGRTRRTSSRPRRSSSKRAGRHRPPGRGASPRRTSPRHGPSSDGSKVTSPSPCGPRSRRCGSSSTPRTRWRSPGGDRPKRCSEAARDERAGPAPRPRSWSRRRWRSRWARAHSCGICETWRAGRASTCRTTVDRLLEARPVEEATAGSTSRGNGHDRHHPDLVKAIVGEPAPKGRGDTFGLSGREREVLLLLAEGRTNREIGERLFISQKTVGVHVGNILAKLEVSGRVEAAAVAIRLGITDRPESRVSGR